MSHSCGFKTIFRSELFDMSSFSTEASGTARRVPTEDNSKPWVADFLRDEPETLRLALKDCLVGARERSGSMLPRRHDRVTRPDGAAPEQLEKPDVVAPSWPTERRDGTFGSPK